MNTIVLIMILNASSYQGVGSSGRNIQRVTKALLETLWMILRTKLRMVQYTMNKLRRLSLRSFADRDSVFFLIRYTKFAMNFAKKQTSNGTLVAFLPMKTYNFKDFDYSLLNLNTRKVRKLRGPYTKTYTIIMARKHFFWVFYLASMSALLSDSRHILIRLI